LKIVMTKQMLDELKHFAELEGVSQAAYTRMALKAALSKSKNGEEA